VAKLNEGDCQMFKRLFSGKFVQAMCAPILALVLPSTGLLAQAPEAAQKPNIVLVLVDDAALMDFGVYGGEARTPHIDALAAGGAVFTQYRTSPLCSPTRAMLLTGMDNHLTGVATIPEVLPSEQVGKPGYIMSLEQNVLTIADRLQAAGYRTLMSGKWHLGEEPETLPQAHGFDRSFALAASGADNWEEKAYMPFYQDESWYEDGVRAHLPDDFYSSRFIVDKAIDYLQEGSTQQPFFAYLAFQAIHIPVQAPAEFIARYKGRYDTGWDALRLERHQRAQELGLVSPGAALADLPPDMRAWDSLSAEDQALYAARMEVNAAMLDAMDHYLGRFIEYLKSRGLFENTIFVITSDNGPEPSRGDDSAVTDLWFWASGYNIGLDNMGGPRSWGFIGPEWAAAAASPGAWFKFYATEGGIRAPLIIYGPGITSARIESPAMVTDIAPTLMEWIEAPQAPESARPMTGRSLLPVLSGEVESVYRPDEIRAIEVSGNAALYKGDYKITRSVPPVGDGKWRLFNLAEDPGETTDLSASEPEILAELLSEYGAYEDKMGVLPMPEHYDSVKQIIANSQARLLQNYPWLYLVAAIILIILLSGLWLIVRMVWGRVSRQ
jgi:arylsulfatase/uncharacterized sulfatase